MSVEAVKPGAMIGRKKSNPHKPHPSINIDEQYSQIVATLTKLLHRADSRHSESETQSVYVRLAKGNSQHRQDEVWGECPHEWREIVPGRLSRKGQ